MGSAEQAFRALRRVWRSAPIPTGLRRRLKQLAGRRIVQLRTRLLPKAAPVERLSPGSVVVSGFLSESLGVGRGARLTLQALRDAGLAVRAHDVRALLRGEESGIPALAEGGPGGVWILHCNPPEAAAVLVNTPYAAWRERYIVGYWAWELQSLPPSWAALARVYHEIWVPSRFVAQAVAPHARRVRIMPHPVPVADPPPAAASAPPATFRFAVIVNARSSLARKNPLGAVHAYRTAFPAPSERVRLTIKLSDPGADPAGVRELLHEIADRPDIDVVERELSDAEMADFFTSIDALISLHRAEGFGLTIAETLALGKPVIATSWSGNLDYMAERLGEWLVPYSLVQPVDRTHRYVQGQWAEPDLDAAAALIRRVFEDPALRTRMSAAGRACVPALHLPWRREALDLTLLSQVG